MNSRSDGFRKSAGGGMDSTRRLVRTTNAMQPWSSEDDNYLREHWGDRGGVQSIASAIGRSVSAVRVRAARLGLGPYINGGVLVSFNVLYQIIVGADIVGGYQWTKERWKSLGLHYRFVRSINNRFCMVDVEEFWRWSKKHQDILDFSRFEENALGKEPKWVKEKRRIDTENRRIQQMKKCPWSHEEVALLRDMLEHGATYQELERALLRSSGAIRRKIYDLYLPKPKRSKQVEWTDDDMRTLVRMVNQGYSQDYCAKQMNRSCQAIRGRIDRLRAHGLWSQYE